MTVWCCLNCFLYIISVFLNVFLELRTQRSIICRNAIVGSALENRKMFGCFCNYWNCLNPCRTSPNLTNTLSCKIHTIMGPLPRVVPISLKVIKSWELRNICRRKTANCCYQIFALDFSTVFCFDKPNVLCLRVMS